MPFLAPRVRDDLEYFEQVIDGEDIVLVRDPVRNTYFRYNVLQAGMLRALDGYRTASEISALLSEQFDVEVPPQAAERFVARARELMLLDISAYKTTPTNVRKHVRRAMRRAGFRERSTTRPDEPRSHSTETTLFAEAFRQLDLDHPRAAAAYLSDVLEINPYNARARQLRDLIQGAFIRAAGSSVDVPTWVVFNPSRLLAWLSRTVGRFVFSWVGLLALLVWVFIGVHAYGQIDFDRITGQPIDVALAIAIVMAAAFCHELGHGLACQHFGGNVTEIGFMLFYYVQPAAYCDTSSSYTIPARRHKMMIQLNGALTSVTVISTHAILLALISPDVPIYPGLALAFVIASALAFLTLIPFIKNDGYYAICDYFGFPNLRDRSFKLARAWLSERLLGIPIATEELPPRTRRLLIAYAIASFLFTAWFVYVIYFKVCAPIVERFRGTGLLFAVVLSVYLMRNVMLRPVWNFGRLLVRERRRIFTPRRTVVLLLVVCGLVGPWFLRWPVLIDAGFVVLPQQRADVRSQTAGRVDAIFVKEGDRVHRGQPIATLRNPALRARIEMLEAELETAAHHRELVRTGARAEELAVARSRFAQKRAEVRLSSSEASVARQLAEASLGTQTSADRAGGLAATTLGVAGAARWAVSLLEAGPRREDIAIAEATYARIASQLAQLRSDEALLTLRSPIDGVIATPHLGDKLQVSLEPGDLFAEVHDLDAVVAEIALSSSDPLAEIEIGDEVAIRPHGVPHIEVIARVERFREQAQDANGERRIVAVTSPFALAYPVSGLTGHARIYGAERSLAYANLYLPLQRLVRVRLWSMY